VCLLLGVLQKLSVAAFIGWYDLTYSKKTLRVFLE
jgi:hypothetical protein